MSATGIGWDSHRLMVGRPLILGGVTVPHDHGLDGHSDADVLSHAITDAILGAAGLGDIGDHFPDTDSAYKGADSIVLLQTVLAHVAELGWQVRNVDTTVVAERPKAGRSDGDHAVEIVREPLGFDQALPTTGRACEEVGPLRGRAVEGFRDGLAGDRRDVGRPVAEVDQPLQVVGGPVVVAQR